VIRLVTNKYVSKDLMWLQIFSDAYWSRIFPRTAARPLSWYWFCLGAYSMRCCTITIQSNQQARLFLHLTAIQNHNMHS